MVALLKDRKSDQFGTPDQVLTGSNAFPVKAASKIFAGAMVAINASGFAVPASADPTLKIAGVATKLADNTLAGALDGDVTVEVDCGVFYMDPGAGAEAPLKANYMAVVFASDDHTVNLTDLGGVRPACGTVWGPPRTDGQVPVLLGMGSLYAINPEITPTASAILARAKLVVTTNVAALAAYTVAAGATNDNVAAVQGDVILLVAQTVPAQNGPYVVGVVGGGTAPLTRPDWWAAGATLKTGAEITIAGLGTVFKNTVWQTMLAADSFVVDTTDPKLYPLEVSGSTALVAGTFTISTVPIFSANSQVILQRKVANTTAATVMYAPTNAGADGITPGVIGVAAAIVQALVAAGTINAADLSTLHWTIVNQA